MPAQAHGPAEQPLTEAARVGALSAKAADGRLSAGIIARAAATALAGDSQTDAAHVAAEAAKTAGGSAVDVAKAAAEALVGDRLKWQGEFSRLPDGALRGTHHRESSKLMILGPTNHEISPNFLICWLEFKILAKN